jgi:hypothetical protein
MAFVYILRLFTSSRIAGLSMFCFRCSNMLMFDSPGRGRVFITFDSRTAASFNLSSSSLFPKSLSSSIAEESPRANKSSKLDVSVMFVVTIPMLLPFSLSSDGTKVGGYILWLGGGTLANTESPALMLFHPLLLMEISTP